MQKVIQELRQPGGTLRPLEIVDIAYDGWRDVWDIETDGHRSFLAGGVAVHNCQDFDPDLVSPILRVTDATRVQGYGWIRYSGTSKTTATLLEQEWLLSSMGEWAIQCQGCKHRPGRNNGWNIPSIDNHVMKMIGPVHNNIGPEDKGGVAGLVCAWCRKPLMPGRMVREGEEFQLGYHGFGAWIHRNKGLNVHGVYDEDLDRRWQYPGLHIPQVIIKMHYANRDNWSEIVREQETSAPNAFQNEILGEACDTGASLFTKKDLMIACDLGHENFSRPAIEEILRDSRPEDRYLCVDWGGGTFKNEEKTTSFTKMALLVLRRKADGIHMDIPWGKRLSNPLDQEGEADEVYKHFLAFRCGHLAHDFNGAGNGRLTILRMKGLNIGKRSHQIEYVSPSTKSTFKYVEANDIDQPLGSLRVNKTALFQLVASTIRARKMHFFNFDFKAADNPGLISDFLNLVPEMRKADQGHETQVISKRAGTSDDFAHAVAIGCAACWYANKELPRLGYRVSFD